MHNDYKSKTNVNQWYYDKADNYYPERAFRDHRIDEFNQILKYLIDKECKKYNEIKQKTEET